MPKSVEGEVLGPQHEYDNPELSPKEFLLAVMRDPRMPIAARMDAASKVAVYEHPRLAQVNQNLEAGLTIRIHGGLPALPGTNIIMPDIEKGGSQPSPAAKKMNGSGGHSP